MYSSNIRLKFIVITKKCDTRCVCVCLYEGENITVLSIIRLQLKIIFLTMLRTMTEIKLLIDHHHEKNSRNFETIHQLSIILLDISIYFFFERNFSVKPTHIDLLFCMNMEMRTFFSVKRYGVIFNTQNSEMQSR